jgi:hypothetical protein
MQKGEVQSRVEGSEPEDNLDGFLACLHDSQKNNGDKTLKKVRHPSIYLGGNGATLPDFESKRSSNFHRASNRLRPVGN